MRIFVYEFVTGGGGYQVDGALQLDPLEAEARAMVHALASDLGRLPGVELDVLRDCRFREFDLPGATVHEVASSAQEQLAIRRLAARADWSIVIAPEFCGYLAARCRLVERAGGRLLGPSSVVVALASDKHATCEHLAAHDVNVPRGTLVDGDGLPGDFAYPAVLKPRDGAGSQGLQLVESVSAVNPWRRRRTAAADWRLEAFCPGTAASVACLCGPGSIVPLPACRQMLTTDGRFTYLGGWLPIDPALARRATALAARAVATLTAAVGYLGVDLVLGDDPSGSDDVVVEINPRFTTSYIGYRALAGQNLAAALLAIASGKEFAVAWRSGRVRFDTSGRVRSGPLPG